MKLCRYLNQARSGRADYASEVGIVDFAIHRRRSVELRVVENIESFYPDIERLEFGDPNSFVELDVEILNSRTMEKTPESIPQLAQSLGSKQAGIERGLAVARVRIELEGSGRPLRRVQQFIVHAIAERTEKRAVRIVEERHRKSRGQSRCA